MHRFIQRSIHNRVPSPSPSFSSPETKKGGTEKGEKGGKGGPYDNVKFRSTSNTPNGQVSSLTTFHYHQSGDMIWAEYSGGSIVRGHLIGFVRPFDSPFPSGVLMSGRKDEEAKQEGKREKELGRLEFKYHHVDEDHRIMTGECESIPTRLGDGRIRLIEMWRWTCGDGSVGESVVEEVREGSDGVNENRGEDEERMEDLDGGGDGGGFCALSVRMKGKDASSS